MSRGRLEDLLLVVGFLALVGLGLWALTSGNISSVLHVVSPAV